MANSAKVLARTAAATSSATLYTVPSATKTVVTNICVTNTASSSGTFEIALNGVILFKTVSVAANTTAAIDIKQVLNATQTITGFASATTMVFHISGMEIT
jgi:hypothetical protein